MEPKSILSSKTVWFNLAVAAFAVLVDNTDLLRSYLPDGAYLLLMMLVSAANVYLRTLTSVPVKLK